MKEKIVSRMDGYRWRQVKKNINVSLSFSDGIEPWTKHGFITKLWNQIDSLLCEKELMELNYGLRTLG